MKPYRVNICMPSRDLMCAATTFDLVSLIGAMSEIAETKYSVVVGSILPDQRTTLVKGALKSDCSHVLFVDGDMRFPADAFHQLVKHDVPVAVANYRFRLGPPRWTACDLDGNQIETAKNSTGVQEVGSIGFGVALIQTDVFRQVPQPWFGITYDEAQDRFLTDDAFFAARCRLHGTPLLMDHDVSQKVRHIGSVELGVAQ